jgi:hypothetical protein
VNSLEKTHCYPRFLSIETLKAESEPHTTKDVLFSPYLALIDEIIRKPEEKKPPKIVCVLYAKPNLFCMETLNSVFAQSVRVEYIFRTLSDFSGLNLSKFNYILLLEDGLVLARDFVAKKIGELLE